MVTNIMNNTKTTTLAVIAAVLIAATLVVGGTFAATSTHSAFAYQKKKGSQDSSKNDNAITPQKSKQDGIVSGFDNSFNQELQNVICTHPSSTCSTEGSEGAATTAGGGGGAQLGPEGLYLLGDTEYTVSKGPSGSSCTKITSFQPFCIPLPTP
jgi:hypothetical protein